LQLAGRAQSEPERIDRWVAAPALLEAMTPQDIADTAARYLDLSEAVEVHVVPGVNARPTARAGRDEPETDTEEEE
jgi:zinc protease